MPKMGSLESVPKTQIDPIWIKSDLKLPIKLPFFLQDKLVGSNISYHEVDPDQNSLDQT